MLPGQKTKPMPSTHHSRRSCTPTRPDASVTPPRGRPPARVLLGLTLVAAAVHGCVLDGVPLGGLQTPAYAALPLAATVQVRQIAAAPAAELPPPAAVDTTMAPHPARPAPKRVLPAVQIAGNTSVPAPGTPAAEPAETVSPPSDVPLDAAPASVTPASAAEPPPPQLRQPERPVPVYKTRIPPLTTTIEYEIRRGGLSGTGELKLAAGPAGTTKCASGRQHCRLHPADADQPGRLRCRRTGTHALHRPAGAQGSPGSEFRARHREDHFFKSAR